MGADGTTTSYPDKLCRACDQYKWLAEFYGPKADMCISCKIARKAERIAQRCQQLFDELPKQVGNRRLLRVIHMTTSDGAGFWAVLECACGKDLVIPNGRLRRGVVPDYCKSCAPRAGFAKRLAESTARTVATDTDADRRELARRQYAFTHEPVDSDRYFHAFMAAFSHVPITLEMVGEYYGLTRERVRQIESIALSKLRRLDAETGGQLRETLDHMLERRQEHRGLRSSSLSWDEIPTYVESST